VLEDGREGRDTNTSTNEDSDLGVEDILSGGTVRTVDHDLRERLGAVDLDEVATRRAELLRLLVLRRERSGGERLDDRRAGTDHVTETVGPVTDLTNVHGDVRVLRSRRDGELQQG
jgi:hypothetical protein